MNTKKITLLAGVVLASVALGMAAGWLLKENFKDTSPSDVTMPPKEKKPLFYRNPMDASITSPVPQKDNMGMDYIPVYADEKSDVQEENKILFYRNPMDPNITSPTPQKDNMGMDYIPVYANKMTATGSVDIDPRVVQNLGVRTAVVQRQSFSTTIDTVGTVAIDERGVSFFNPKISGWVERVYVKALGDSIQRGQLLAEIYAPELVSAQEEFLVALNGVKRFADAPLLKDSQSLLETARARLRLLDMSNADIEALERSGQGRRTIKLYAPHNGIVTELNMREGGYITPDTRLYSLADLSRAWVIMEIYTGQMAFVKPGNPVTLRTASMPGREWRGRIDYLYPTLNPQTRTVQARLVFDNPGNTLRPGMFVNASIQSTPKASALAVPREALLRTGTRDVVMVALGAGRFQPVTVRTGAENSELVEILEGLEAGQQVVLSGQFLLDAEASFKGGMDRLEGNNTGTPIQDDHAEHQQ
jgi:Cu(I)/Ag(I) efflux system membrane fusion protein